MHKGVMNFDDIRGGEFFGTIEGNRRHKFGLIYIKVESLEDGAKFAVRIADGVLCIFKGDEPVIPILDVWFGNCFLGGRERWYTDEERADIHYLP